MPKTKCEVCGTGLTSPLQQDWGVCDHDCYRVLARRLWARKFERDGKPWEPSAESLKAPVRA